jgi:hypothetical protein
VPNRQSARNAKQEPVEFFKPSRQGSPSEDSLCAALAPDLSDSRIQYGSSGDALNFCPAWLKGAVFLSNVRPWVVPCEVFQVTWSPLLIAITSPYKARPVDEAARDETVAL